MLVKNLTMKDILNHPKRNKGVLTSEYTLAY